MIGQLRGRLADKRPNQVLVDVGGVGYVVAVPLSTYAALDELHTEVTLLIHTHVREDALSLYGFLSSREKHLFEMLLSASGVGPTLALKILSGMSAEELCRILLEDAGVAAIPGAAFGPAGKDFIRFSFASSMETLHEAVKRMQKVSSAWQATAVR